MSRWALFVDAGWLFAAGATSAFGEPLTRKEIIWSPQSLVSALVPRAAQLVPDSTELLRTYWYDGSPNRLPVGQQHDVAQLRDVKLRLGRTARGGQKGVDGLIIHDLITHAFRRTIDDAVIMSGDEDLLDAIESAQANGTRVHLLEIPIGGIAAALLRAVDSRGLIDEEFWQEHLHRVDEPTVEPVTGNVETVGPGLTPTQVPAKLIAVGAPPPPPTDLRPRWLDLPLLEPEAAPDRQAQIGEMVEVGASFAERWAAEAGGDEYAEVLAARPYLPANLDAELLRSASPDGAWLDQADRRALRDAFWAALADIGPSGRTGP